VFGAQETDYGLHDNRSGCVVKKKIALCCCLIIAEELVVVPPPSRGGRGLARRDRARVAHDVSKDVGGRDLSLGSFVAKQLDQWGDCSYSEHRAAHILALRQCLALFLLLLQMTPLVTQIIVRGTLFKLMRMMLLLLVMMLLLYGRREVMVVGPPVRPTRSTMVRRLFVDGVFALPAW
jgi:hypothetical protein